jgi:hypothetical protein
VITPIFAERYSGNLTKSVGKMRMARKATGQRDIDAEEQKPHIAAMKDVGSKLWSGTPLNPFQKAKLCQRRTAAQTGRQNTSPDAETSPHLIWKIES